jgi:DNA replication protein DnaC
VTERDLRALLRALGLSATADALDDLIALATKKRWSPVELFEHVAALEDKDRAQRGLDRRLKRSRLERFKPMADYDWNWPTKIDRPLVESVLRLDFLAEPRNVVLAAAQGLGKTMIAQNVAHNAVLGGHGVLFIRRLSSCSISVPKNPLEPWNAGSSITPRAAY